MPTIGRTISGSALVGNLSKDRTITDAQLQDLLDWARVAFDPYIQATFNAANNPAFVATNAQILSAWDQAWVTATINAVRQFKTPAPIAPAPIVIA